MNASLKQAENLMQQALKAYNTNNFSEGNMLRNKSNAIFESFKNDTNIVQDNIINSIYGENKNFGVIHKVFEHNVPSLYKTKNGKKIIGNYLKTIKEDKNLMKEFAFYNELLSVDDVSDVALFVNEAIDLIPNINKKELITSNDKLIKIIQFNKLDEKITIDDKTYDLFESIEFMLTNNKKLNNLSSFVNAKNNISNYINEHIEQSKNSINESLTNESLDDFANKSIMELNIKYKNVLNEAEKDFVKELISVRSEAKEEKCKAIFEKCKKEALDAINSVIKEADADIKEKLLSLKERMLDKEFDNDKLVKDVAEMLEIKNTLIDE